MRNNSKTVQNSPGAENRAHGAIRLRSGKKLRTLPLYGALTLALCLSCAMAQTSRHRLDTAAFTPGQAVPAAMPASPPALSPQAIMVQGIASRRGDQTYLILDKVRGEIILFANGEPIYSGAALTGQSFADVLPPGLTERAFTTPAKLEEKVTPAGRFTVARESDPAYGTIFTLNEIKGKDWDIAIHRVALVPSEHRPERLRSPSASDRHITNGCVNVERDTIHVLERFLTGRNIPIYILPQDPNVVLTLFSLGQSGVREATSAR
jgi:L,D-transpeptidase catalytic domain